MLFVRCSLGIVDNFIHGFGMCEVVLLGEVKRSLTGGGDIIDTHDGGKRGMLCWG